MKHIKLFLFLLSFLTCKQVFSQFAKGADIGWLSEMESKGRKFYDKNGTQKDLLDILKEYDINSVRLRVWVNPPAGYCNKADVIKQAVRAKNKGFRIMIDFHYSDSWADPGQQTKPVAWKAFTITQLTKAVYDHTADVLTGLRDAGVHPEWVQVGNETNNGALWPEGTASVSMANFASIVLSGHNAVKAIFPQTKVIVHISNGFDNGLFRWMFDGLKNNNAKWDVIGMSLYPEQEVSATTWQVQGAQCLTNMNDMVSRYSKEVMIVETGMPWSDANASFSNIQNLITKNRSLSQGKGLGVFYWEPQGYNGWNGYQKGAFDNSGKPTHAMDAFLEGANAPNQDPQVSISVPANNTTVKTNTSVTLTATASDPDGTVSKVDFYSNGGVKLGTKTGSPYSFAWTTPAATGTHTITAMVYDNDGEIKISSPITINVSNTVTGLEEEEIGTQTTIFPNPFQESVLVNKNGNYTLQIFNSTGILIERREASGPVTIHKNLTAGVYYFKITDYKNRVETYILNKE